MEKAEFEAAVTGIAADIAAHAPYAARGREVVGGVLSRGYAVQDAVVAALMESGARGDLAGYKLAANSAALMERFGLSEPVSGRLFADQRLDSPATVPASDWREPAFEPEIAAILRADLGAGADRAAAAAAVERLVPAFELLDMREIEKPPSDMAEAVGQNITNEGVVLGGPGVAPEDLPPLEAIETVLTVDGSETARVTGAVPQDPLEAVAWMARHLAGRGLALRAGMLVLCGTHTPIQFPPRGAEVVLETTGLGRAEMRL